jgi:cyclopropane fatty-acyl-phospholipid synthase-like methyltransferase
MVVTTCEETSAPFSTTSAEMLESSSSTAIVLDEDAISTSTQKASVPSDVDNGYATFPQRTLFAFLIGLPLYFSTRAGLGLISTLLLAVCLAPTLFAVFLLMFSARAQVHAAKAATNREPASLERYLHIKHPALRMLYTGKQRIPVSAFVEAYLSGEIDLATSSTSNADNLLELFEERHAWATFELTLQQAHYFLMGWLPSFSLAWLRRYLGGYVALLENHMTWFSKTMTVAARDKDGRQEDFYYSYLVPDNSDAQRLARGVLNRLKRGAGTTSTVDDEEEDNDAIESKAIQLACQRMRLSAGDRHLDVGCGHAGRLVRYATTQYQSLSTGVAYTRFDAELAKRLPMAFADTSGLPTTVTETLADRLRFRHASLDEFPAGRFDKISVLDPLEHMNHTAFPEFLNQLYTLLRDDGIIYLQSTALRRTWQLEDISWSLFMTRYIHPMMHMLPSLHWQLGQIEAAGFEVVEMEDLSRVWYADLLARQYRRWHQRHAHIVSVYGERWWRVWAVYLAWSTVMAREGALSAYYVVAHKNHNTYDRCGQLEDSGQ